jgi:hypothetical protein
MIKKLKCKAHKDYTATKEPKSDCERCWLIWLAMESRRLRQELKELKVELEQKEHYIDQIHGYHEDDWW